MTIDNWAATQNFKESFEDLSPAQINALSFEDFARLSGRPSPAQAAIATLDARYEATNPQTQTPPTTQPQSAPQPPDAPQGLDPNSDEYFAAWRANRKSGGEGKGIFSGSSTQDWIAAAQSQPGRSSWQGSNVVEPPRLTDRYVRHDSQIDTRSARDRFATPGNSWQG